MLDAAAVARYHPGVIDPEGARTELELLRKMTPEERILMSFRLRRVALEFCRAGIRYQNPGYSEADVERELQRRILPTDLFARLFPT